MAVMTPIETEEIVSNKDILWLIVDSQIINFDHLVRYCSESVFVERIKLNIKDAFMAALFDLIFCCPRGSDVTHEKAVERGRQQVSTRFW